MQGHDNRHTVIRGAWFKPVAHRELRLADRHVGRVAGGIGFVADHEFGERPFERGLRVLCQAPVPRVQRLRVVHVRRQAVEIPLGLPFLVDDEAGPALLGFFFLGLGEGREVAREECAAGVDLTGEQRIAHEDVPRLLREQRAVVDRTLGREHEAEQGDLFAADDAALRTRPAWIVLATREQVRQGIDGPFGFDAGVGERPHAFGVEQRRGQQPRRRLLRQRRTGEQLELATARAVVEAAVRAMPELRGSPVINARCRSA
jgi:hypothetical protein